MDLRPVTGLQNPLPYYPNLRAVTMVLPTAGEYTVRFVMASAVQPRLERLSIIFAPAAVMPQSLGEGSYPCLDTLEIEGYNQKCIEFLALLSTHPPPRLTSLSVTCLSLEQPTEEFFQTVASAVPHLTLRSLSLSFHPNYDSTARTTFADIKPLFVLEELKELRIQAGNPFHIDSTALEMIGAAFPQLTVLCLNSPRAEDESDELGATFSWGAVVALARTCQLLAELSLPIALALLPSISAYPSTHDNDNGNASDGNDRQGGRSVGDPAIPSLRPQYHRPTAPSPTSREIFLGLKSFLLNDFPLLFIPFQRSLPAATATHTSQTSPLASPSLTPLASQAPSSSTLATVPQHLASVPSHLPSPFSRSPTRSPSRNPQYAALATLVRQTFPNAQLGVHVSRFERGDKR